MMKSTLNGGNLQQKVEKRLSEMTRCDVEAYLKGRDWTYAQSYEDSAPHEYLVRDDTADEIKFLAAALFIQREGYEEPFYNTTFTYIDIDGKKYWTMSNALPNTYLINRADKNRSYGE